MIAPAVAAPAAVRVAVCVITYRRPQGLQRLLDGLGRQTFTRCPAPELRIIAVDNDPEGSAEAVCRTLQDRPGMTVEYLRESRRGIPFARNAAVLHVGASADFIAFVDDDEVPDPRWLDELLHAQAIHQAHVVSGPVISEFEDPPPAWVIRGRFFDRERLSTGAPLTVARTGNVLIKTDVFRAMNPIFDERMALTGGSDTHFFLRVWRAGFKMIWADDAVITEWVSGSRITAGYVLRRGYRTGNTRGICERDFGHARGQRGVGFVRATWWIAKGLLLLPPSLLMGTHAAVRAVRGMCAGAGYFAGRMGARFEEYRVTDGR
jgi:succinoglycan biosynthesis protein ExoM